MAKICCRCNELLPESEFHQGRPGKLQSHCKGCDRKRDRKTERQRHQEKVAARVSATELTCCTCKETKPLDQFYKNKSSWSGRARRCSSCCRSDANARNATPHGRDRKRAARRKYRVENPGYDAWWNKELKEKDPERYSRLLRNRNLQKKYGISAEEYDEKFKEIEGQCCICKKTFENPPKNPREKIVVDHCHATGKIRGFICSHCNVGLGLFFDSPVALREAALYIERHYALE